MSVQKIIQSFALASVFTLAFQASPALAAEESISFELPSEKGVTFYVSTETQSETKKQRFHFRKVIGSDVIASYRTDYSQFPSYSVEKTNELIRFSLIRENHHYNTPARFEYELNLKSFKAELKGTRAAPVIE